MVEPGLAVGFTLARRPPDLLALIPQQAWTPAYDTQTTSAPGPRFAELSGLLDLSTWPAGMRVIIRKERPHPGAH